jgi:hypothetical protein
MACRSSLPRRPSACLWEGGRCTAFVIYRIFITITGAPRGRLRGFDWGQGAGTRPEGGGGWGSRCWKQRAEWREGHRNCAEWVGGGAAKVGGRTERGERDGPRTERVHQDGGWQPSCRRPPHWARAGGFRKWPATAVNRINLFQSCPCLSLQGTGLGLLGRGFFPHVMNRYAVLARDTRSLCDTSTTRCLYSILPVLGLH